VKLTEEFVACVFCFDFIEPARVWFRVFRCDYFDDIAIMKGGIKGNHLAIYDGASTGGTNFAMEAIGKV